MPALVVMPAAFVLVALGVDTLLATPWGSRVRAAITERRVELQLRLAFPLEALHLFFLLSRCRSHSRAQPSPWVTRWFSWMGLKCGLGAARGNQTGRRTDGQKGVVYV